MSVFDYRTVTDDQLTHSLDACPPYHPARGCGYELAILFLDAEACKALETWDRLPADERYRGMFVSYVEACYPGPIEIARIEELLRVHITPPPPHPFVNALLGAGRS